jgi:hypothetical protein
MVLAAQDDKSKPPMPFQRMNDSPIEAIAGPHTNAIIAKDGTPTSTAITMRSRVLKRRTLPCLRETRRRVCTAVSFIRNAFVGMSRR